MPQAAAKPAPKANPDPVLLGSEELAEGWISLFDGQTLFGWKAGSQADWRVEDGTIVVGSGEKGLLYTTTQYCNYVLRVDFRAATRNQQRHLPAHAAANRRSRPPTVTN